MGMPQIIFRYSSIYDQLFEENYNKEQGGEEKDLYPSREETQTFIETLKPLWKKVEKDVLEEISSITTLPWHEEQILCYVVGRTISFSDPLTIPAYVGYEDYAIDVLTHELIHQNFSQGDNYPRSLKSWDHFLEKYKLYAYNTQLHIPLEAIHTAIYHKLFDTKRLRRDIDFLSQISEYKDAWDIVEKEGYKGIVKDFVERIK